MSILQKLDEIGSQALKEVQASSSLEEIERVRVAVLGKKGALSEVLKGLGQADPAERPKIGAAANQWKQKIESALDELKAKLEQADLESKLKNERIDISIPAREPYVGSLHVVTQTTRKIIDVFARLGFDVATGPEVETEFLNFDAVNIPADHPARDMQDTFFMGPGVVLRTHTSAIQMRAMRSQKWPIRILCPGAVYRSDNDATHLPQFHQIEGLWIDRGVKMSDLKGTLAFFAREVFGSDTKVRLRPSYFPFVEPGAEVDVSCFNCRGKGPAAQSACRLCKGTSWIEILGAGMVHPRLFDMAGYGEDYRQQGLTGFAFGMGIERIAMLLHGIPDLRLMVQGESKFLKQF